jgi:hypothetical protein
MSRPASSTNVEQLYVVSFRRRLIRYVSDLRYDLAEAAADK